MRTSKGGPSPSTSAASLSSSSAMRSDVFRCTSRSPGGASADRRRSSHCGKSASHVEYRRTSQEAPHSCSVVPEHICASRPPSNPSRSFASTPPAAEAYSQTYQMTSAIPLTYSYALPPRALDAVIDATPYWLSTSLDADELSKPWLSPSLLRPCLSLSRRLPWP
eukprot:2164147-Pleurochrysis_carterae.AAC.1